MGAAHRRHDISDSTWELIEPHLIGGKGTWGGNARDNRLFINAVFWIMRTGAPWRDLPPDYGDWKNTHRRFCRWRDKGIWEKLLTTRSKTILIFALMATSLPLMPIIHGKAIKN